MSDGKWISVVANLPELSRFVLIYTDEIDEELDCPVRVAWLSRGGWQDSVSYVGETVLYWMPLPAPPKEKP